MERKFKKMCQIQNMKVAASHYSFISHWFHLLLTGSYIFIIFHVLLLYRLIIFMTAGC